VTGGPISTLQEARATYTAESIERMVMMFYSEVRADPLIGPIFERRVADWPSHLERMCAFWGSVLRAEPGYRSERGSPLQIHAAMAELDREHFARWLALFERTVSQVFEPTAAAGVVGRAERMAVALGRHLS
jgi:hemoglobin